MEEVDLLTKLKSTWDWGIFVGVIGAIASIVGAYWSNKAKSEAEQAKERASEIAEEVKPKSADRLIANSKSHIPDSLRGNRKGEVRLPAPAQVK